MADSFPYIMTTPEVVGGTLIVPIISTQEHYLIKSIMDHYQAISVYHGPDHIEDLWRFRKRTVTWNRVLHPDGTWECDICAGVQVPPNETLFEARW